MKEIRSQIAGCRAVNSHIHRCFRLIGDAEVARRFQRRFDEQKGYEWQVMNTYRELVVGGFLAERGLKVKHEPTLGGVTPDWSCADESRVAIVEVATAYLNQRSFDELVRGEVTHIDDSKNLLRVHHTMNEKVAKYGRLAEQHGLVFVIALCIDFSLPLSFDEVVESFMETDGVFASSPSLRGVLLFTNTSQPEQFRFVPNPNARMPASRCPFLSMQMAQ